MSSNGFIDTDDFALLAEEMIPDVEKLAFDVVQNMQYPGYLKKSAAHSLFKGTIEQLELLTNEAVGRLLSEEHLKEAQKTLDGWQEADPQKRAPRYTAAELATARIKKSTTQRFTELNYTALTALYSIHGAVLSSAITQKGVTNSFADRLIAAGARGMKLGVVEVNPRLSPLLFFEDASKYMHGVIVPYGQEFREAVGEMHAGSLVSPQAAKVSAENMRDRYGLNAVLAETSAAPSSRIPRSGAKPRYFIHGVSSGASVQESATLDTSLRHYFDAEVRENMLNALYKIIPK